MAREFDHAYSATYAFCYGAVLSQYLGDVGGTLELADRAIAASREHGFAMWLGVGQALRGWALTAQGDIDKGVPLTTAGIEGIRCDGQLRLFVLLRRIICGCVAPSRAAGTGI